MRQHQYRDMSNLNAPYDDMSLQGLGTLGGGDSLGFNMEEAHNIPWMESSPATLTIQQDLNKSLSAEGLGILLEDGVLGPRTCGALNKYGRLDEVYGACDGHVEEFMAPKAALAPVSIRRPEEESGDLLAAGGGGGGMPSWVWGLLLGGGAIGVAIYLKKKKRGR